MTSVETQLAKWRSQYGELISAELEARQARVHPQSSRETVAELEERVRRVQQRCNATLDAVSAELAARRGFAPTRTSPRRMEQSGA